MRNREREKIRLLIYREGALFQRRSFCCEATARRDATPETDDPSYSYQEADRCPREERWRRERKPGVRTPARTLHVHYMRRRCILMLLLTTTVFLLSLVVTLSYEETRSRRDLG